MIATLIGGPADGHVLEVSHSPLVVPYIDEEVRFDYGAAIADPPSVIGMKHAQYTRERWAMIEPELDVVGGKYRNGGKLLAKVVEPAMKDVPGYALSHLDEYLPPFRKAWRVDVTVWLCDTARKDAIYEQGLRAGDHLIRYLTALYLQSVDEVQASFAKLMRREACAEWHRLAWLMSPTDKEGTLG